jgi:hypothetical protein
MALYFKGVFWAVEKLSIRPFDTFSPRAALNFAYKLANVIMSSVDRLVQHLPPTLLLRELWYTLY